MNSPFQPRKLQVPGLMGDDALNQSLKQYASSLNAGTAAAPPPDSAVDMIPRIQNEYLAKPAAVKAPSMRGAAQVAAGPLGPLVGAVGDVVSSDGPPAQQPVDPQQNAINIRSDMLAGGAADLSEAAAGSPVLRGTPFGIIGQLAEAGTLNPEEQQAEADARAQDFKRDVQATTDHMKLREQLRNLSDDDAAKLGIPVEPGGSQPETAGPLPSEAVVPALKLTPQELNLYQHHVDNVKNGKFVRNADGSISTLYQTSVDIQGRTYNFPTVWDGKILPVDQAVQRALKEKPLKDWPSYASPDEAEARYGQMHDALAGDVAPLEAGLTQKEQSAQQDQKHMQELGQRNAEAIAATKDPSKQPTQTWWLNALQSGVKGVASIPISSARFFGGELPEMMRDASGVGAVTGWQGQRSNVRAWVDTVDATLTKMLPGDKARAKDFATQLSQGGGSMLGFILGGYIAAARGLPAWAGSAVLGAATQGDQQFQDAENFQANTVSKYMSLILGGALGLSEALPIDRMFMRADHATGGLVRRMLAHTAAGSAEEFMQEFGQAVGQDVVARWFYDEKRKFDLKSYVQQGLVGAITGGLAGAATTALHDSGVSTQPADATPPEQRQTIAQQAIDALSGQLDKLPGMAEHEAAELANQPLANIASPAPAAAEPAPVVQGKGGSIPVNASGQFEANHESGQQLDVIDPVARGTGPLRGGERQRLFGPDAVDRSYFGVGQPDYVRPKDQPYRLDTDPYHGEGLGPFRHTVEADPNTIYNWFEDPLNLKSQLDRTAPPSEQVTKLERLIKAAGFKGIYYSESPLGQTALMFDKTTPSRVIDKRSGLVQNFKAPTAEELQATPLQPEDTTPLPGLEKSTGPVPSVVQAGRAYAEARGLPIRRQADYVKADPERGARIAAAYEKMKHAPNNPKVKAAYQAMADETLAQYQFVKATGLKIDAIEPGQPDPYPEGPKQVLADLQKGHLWFFPTESGFGTLTDIKDNPLLAPTNEKIGDRTLLVNDVFRIVHDFFGHGMEGAGFGARGEENAWQAHMRLYSPAALPAVTSETRGQNSWVNFGPHGEANRANQRETVYADQKTGIMPAWTWQEGVADDGSEMDLLANIHSPQRLEGLMDQVPGLKKIAGYLTPDEQAKLSKANASKIVDIFTNLPDAEEMAAVAFSGRAKRGWYARSAKALVDIFGLNDAPRFAGLLAALSPQTSVESNAVNALAMWVNWDKAGRPTDEAAITKLLGKSVQGGGTESSVLPAWINNAVTALAEPDAMNITLSGPKVDSFMKNLQGKVNEVTNDAWMANFANVEQTLFKKTGASPGKGPGYIGMSAVVRQAANIATELTGETWTPAEVQETVWSWAKTLYEKASAAGENRTAEQIVEAAGMTADEISATPDFASLFVSGVYRKLLEQGGLDVDSVAAGGGRSDEASNVGSSPFSAEGSGFAGRSFQRNLGQAARRLDALRARRAGQDLSVSTDETFFPDVAQRQGQLDHLTADDRQFLDDNLLANVGSRGPLKGEQQRPDQGIATPAQTQQTAEHSDASLAKIKAGFVKLMGLTVRQGRLTLKGGAVGQYDRKQSVVRAKNVNDLSTIVHEGGHELYFTAGNELKMFIAGNDQLLMKVADDLYGGDTNVMPKATHIAEGFAEFFRVYTLNRAYAERKYQPLVDAFDKVLDKDAPQLKAGLDLVGKQYAAWLQLPSSQMVKNMIVPGKRDGTINEALQELHEAGFGTWMHEYARNIVRDSVNRFAPLNDIVNQTLNVAQENKGKALDLKRADDPRILMRLATNSGARAMVEATDGVMGYNSTTPGTPSLRDALLTYHGKRTDQNLFKIDDAKKADFAAYLVALRGIDEYRRLADGKIKRPPVTATLGDLQVTVQEMEAKYGTAFTEAAKMVHEYAMGLWQKAYDAGLMTEESYLDGLDRQFYAPLQRDMSDKKASFGSSALTGKSSLVKRFRGSDRDIIDPMDVLMHKTFALEQIVSRNEVFRTLGLLADRAGQAGALIERVPSKQLMGRQLSVEEVAKQLTKDDDITAADAQDLMEILQASIDNDNVLSFFRSEPVQTKGENIIFGWQDGKLAALQLADGDLGADVVNTLNAVGRETLPLFTGLISSATTVFRGGIVSWPDFLMANFIKDQFSAFIITDVGFKPFYTGLRGVFDELRQGNWGRQYNAAMGTMGGMNVANLHQSRIDRDINALRRQGYIATAFSGSGFRGAMEGVGRIIELTETGIRIGVYKGAYERAIKDGLTPWEASIEGAYTATDMMDFGLNGSRMLLLRKTIPFLNAQLQGMYKMMRTLGADEVRQRKGLNFVLRAYLKSTKNLDLSRTEKQAINTGRKAWVKMASLALISAALHYLFRDDPDYQNAGEYLRTTGWVIPMGDGRLFYVPKPYELAILANFTERALESSEGDAEAMHRFGRGIAMTFTPPLAPPLVQTAVELAANKDFFTDTEIVPSYMQALQPELQFNNYTSTLAKQLGQALGMSPLKIDHVMSSLGASAYRDLMTMYNATDENRGTTDTTDAPIIRRFIRDANRGSATQQDFWRTASMTTGTLRSAEVTYKAYLEAGNQRAADDFLNSLGPDEKAYALLTTDFKADYKRLNPYYRGRQMLTIISAMRREMVTPLGLTNTETKTSDPIKLSAHEKTDLDQALHELGTREMRNTMVAMNAPGWTGKKMLATDTTIALIRRIDPRVGEELQRRIDKAKVYDAATVNQYWPEVKNRLLVDRENTFLDDILSIAKATR